MNESHHIGEAELRMALRGLRREVEPRHDLWPGIAQRIRAMPQQAAAPAPRRVRAWPLATAASLALALGLAWQLRPSTTPELRIEDRAVQREAEMLTAHYRAARSELDRRVLPGELQPAIEALDRSAVEIRAAMRQDPGSRLLLAQLRNTYARRIALARRTLSA